MKNQNHEIKKPIRRKSDEHARYQPRSIHRPPELYLRVRYNPKIAIISGLLLVFIISGLAYRFFVSDKWKQLNYQWGVENLSAGKFDKAAGNFERAASGKNENDALYRLAVSKYNQKDYEGAIAAYQKVIEADAGNPAAYNGLGNLYRDQKNYSLAEENYKKAIAVNGTYVVAYSNWAIMLLDNGKKEEAKKVATDGLGKSPGSVELANLKKILDE